jgi:hypothetical protein
MNDFGLLVGRFFTSLPTLSNEQLSELMLDSAGRLIISGRWLEDSPHVSGDAGLFALGVRDDGVQANATVGPNVFTAVNYGPGGNSIALVFNGTDDVTTVVAAWNSANPSNQVSFTGSGATVPTAQTVTLANGAYQSVQTSDNGDYSPLAVDMYGRLKVSADVTVDPSAAEFNEDSPNASGDTGLHVLTVRQDTLATSTSANGDYADFKVNALGELYVHDTSVLSQLVTIDASLQSILTEVSGLSYAEDSAHASGDMGTMALGVRNDAYASQTSADGDYGAINLDSAGRVGIRGSYAEDSASASGEDLVSVGSVRQDTLASSTSADGDHAHIKSNALGEVYVHDTDVLAQLVAANASLDNIEAYGLAQQHAEDAAHVSGDIGSFALAVRHDAESGMVSADGDYAPLQVTANGRLKVDAAQVPGAEQYSVTDALAAAGDGLATITAAATPWVTVASYAHTSGVAYLYGYQWSCDQNGDARIVTDDGADVIVYKRSLNASSAPTWAEHFSESGRIEIPGSAGLEIRLQIKKRSATGGNAQGTGSLHIRA